MKRPFFFAELPGNPLPPLWLALAMPLVGLGWLVPNHYYPWLAFHTDAWLAVALALLSVLVWWRCPGRVVWHSLTVVAAFLILIPPIQHWTGILPFAGQAWIGSAYVAGLLVAMLTGAQWERSRPGQVADALFCAIGFAAIVSVGIALYQWLDMRGQDVWILGMNGPRTHANLAQPNQLATLLLWGVLSAAWGLLRGKISVAVAVLMAGFLLFGVVLTQSRTAWLSLLVGLLAAFFWPPLARVPRLRWIALGLAIYFFGLAFSLTALSNALLLGFDQRPLEGSSAYLRLQAYHLFVDAVMQRPWTGYGWFQLAPAQLAMAEQHQALEGFFLHSHNLFLDLVLWCGVPIGLAVSAAIAAWVIGSLRSVQSASDAVLVVFILVIGIHAMLELPLHYAYFLLPTGMILGLLNVRLGHRQVGTTGRWAYATLWTASSALLLVIVIDYLEVETHYQAERLRMASIGTPPIGADKPPDVLVLTHLRDYIRFGRTEMRTGMSQEDLNWARDVTHAFASAGNLFNTAKAYALNDQREEAQRWIYRMQKVMSPKMFAQLGVAWQQQAEEHPKMRGMDWPDALRAP
jgi:O-antigen ligase